MRRPKHGLPFDVLHEDRNFIVIDKPAGLLTTHTRLRGRLARETQQTAENLLNEYLRKGQSRSRLRVWLVHRLDRDTSGVMMFAKSRRAAEAMRDRWNEITSKVYVARVEGRLERDSGSFRSFLAEDADGYRVRSVPPETPGAKAARTDWRKLSGDGKYTEVEVYLRSGRKNQIRVHFAEAGHPVAGDVKYGGAKAERMFLHSAVLKYTDPFTGKELEFRA